MAERLSTAQHAAVLSFWTDRRRFEVTGIEPYQRPIIPHEFDHLQSSWPALLHIDAVVVRHLDVFSEGPPHPRGFIRYRTLIVEGRKDVSVHDAEDAVNWLYRHGPPPREVT